MENNAETPLMQQYLKIKAEYKNDVLFFRLGDFYEMFLDDALEISRLLNLTLTHRANYPMCGIPYHASKVYIARLLRLGKKIAICEQIGDAKEKGLAERKVVEIITPGTVSESEYLEGNVNNFLACFCIYRSKAAFAFIDVTTSTFKVTSFQAALIQENFSKELGRVLPREILIPNSLKNNETVQNVLSVLPNISVSYYPDWDFNAQTGYKKLCSQFKTSSLRAFNIQENSCEAAAAGFLIDYLEKTTNTLIPHIKKIDVYFESEYLIIDDSSRRNLEILQNLRDQTVQFSLLECVNQAKTAMGSRMIRQWLSYPLTKKEEILARQNHISLFYENRDLMQNVRQKLENILDIERLASRVAMDRAHPKDLQALKQSLIFYLQVKDELSQFDFARIDEQQAINIINQIQSAILDDPPTSLTDGNIIRAGYSQELDHWKDVQNNFDKILSEYEHFERNRTGIQNLKIKSTNNLGYFIEISRGKLSSVPEDFIKRRSLVTGDRYTTSRLQELEHELLESSSHILQLERDLFLELRTKLHNDVPYLMQIANDIAYTDCSSSFALTASVNNWCRPSISDDERFIVKGGRHPIVEKHLPSGEFVPNDLTIDSSDENAENKKNQCFALITGPNMAGKSTYLRQNALIALLSQIGSYVPADFCEIGIVDKIFCRVGASDNLAKGESTFLVEMIETANILRSSTKKSLVIMDEVGRGTSTEDGLSIAWAVSEYLLNNIKCRSLFATHYHELTRLEHPKMILLCMEVLEQGDSVVFLRKVKSGASENSYGIHVARLAGIPESVILRANDILAKIQMDAENKPIIDMTSTQTVLEEKKSFSAPGLFCDEEIILDEILSCDEDNMTPIAALQLIARWKKVLSGR